MSRAKCRICHQSTSIADGYCEFCGNPLQVESSTASLTARAERLAAAGPPAGPGISTAEEESEGQKNARMAFLIAVAGVFCLPILAPIAVYLGVQAGRQLRAEERASWQAGGAVVLGSLWSMMIVLAVGVLVVGNLTFTSRYEEWRRRESDELRRDVEEILKPTPPPAVP